jgi:hypothetical protein
MIHNIITKLRSIGSVLDKNKPSKCVLTEEKLDDISTQIEASPKKSLCLLALQCGVAGSTAHIGTKLLKLWLYKTTVIQSHLSPDCKARI